MEYSLVRKKNPCLPYTVLKLEGEKKGAGQMVRLGRYWQRGSVNSWGGGKLLYSNKHQESQVEVNWKWLAPNCHSGSMTLLSDVCLDLANRPILLLPKKIPQAVQASFLSGESHFLRLYLQVTVHSLLTKPDLLNIKDWLRFFLHWCMGLSPILF